MNHAHALRLIVAAEDDAVLAAWAAVVLEHRMPAHSEISPYDAWEAYQEFFALGAILGDDYDATDIKRAFFSGGCPPTSQIQDVLHNVLFLCPEHEPEESMSKSNPFNNPGESALSARNDRQSIAPSRSATPLPGGMTTGAPLPGGNGGGAPLVTPFSREREIMPANKTPDLGLHHRERRNLPCADPGGGEDRIRPTVFCGECGEKLDLKLDGSQGLGPDDQPGGNVSVMEAVWYQKCETCQITYHCSVGRAIGPHEAYR